MNAHRQNPSFRRPVRSRKYTALVLLAAVAAPLAAAAGPGPGSAAAGRELWNRERPVADGSRSCAVCHTDDPRRPGRHVTTAKPIEPMSPAVNPARLGDPAKVEKWFRRNCRWTLGRACTEQEKADVIAFLKDG
jgi:hypothetical protein